MFCSPFDEALASAGPPAVFLFDPEGELRFDARWTRDAWGRQQGPHAHRPTWVLARDQGTGWVTRLYCTSPALFDGHPRLQIRTFDDRAACQAAFEALGSPPIAEQPW